MQNEDEMFDLGSLEQTGGAFKDRAKRARIYQFTIIIHEGRISHTFQVSCKRGDHLTINKTLRKMGGLWRGDIFVMRIGKRDPKRPVDMRGKDAGRVDYAVKK